MSENENENINENEKDNELEVRFSTKSDDEDFDSEEISMEEFLQIINDNVKLDKIKIEKKKRRKITIIKPDNNSGMGETAPYSIAKNFNWGAMLFNWIWGLKYKKYILLLAPIFLFIPFGFIISLIICFYAGIKGNQWAWEEVQYKNENDFNNAQQSWVKTWLVFASIALIIGIPIKISQNKIAETEDLNVDRYKVLSTLELNIPKEIYKKTDMNDQHYEFLATSKNIIYWLRPSNELTEKNKKYIEDMFKQNEEQLKSKYILYPDLKELKDKNVRLTKFYIEANCTNDTCIDKWLYQKCNTGYCIINPQKGTYYKVRAKEKVIPKAITLTKEW